MANIGSMLREEITRLARRAARGQIDVLKKTSAQQRRHIAALRRDIAQLTRQIIVLGRRGGSVSIAQGSDAPAGRKVRFVAKGLRSQRERLGLSQAEFGKLVGVSAQSIYQWERGATRPRVAQLNTLASLRSIGKKEARARLVTTSSGGAAKRRRRTKR